MLMILYVRVKFTLTAGAGAAGAAAAGAAFTAFVALGSALKNRVFIIRVL